MEAGWRRDGGGTRSRPAIGAGQQPGPWPTRNRATHADRSLPERLNSPPCRPRESPFRSPDWARIGLRWPWTPAAPRSIVMHSVTRRNASRSGVPNGGTRAQSVARPACDDQGSCHPHGPAGPDIYAQPLVQRMSGSAASRAFERAWRPGHSGRAGIIRSDEHVTFPSLPGDRHPSAGHPLPDLRPYPRLPAG
jgi:hypothetical protein